MAQVTNYTTLGTAFDLYLKRAGSATAWLDYLIQEVEEELNSRLRVRRMLTSVTPTVSAAGVVTLPTDFVGWKRFQVRDGSSEWDLELKSAEQTTEVSSQYGGTGVPKALITTGATSQVWPFTNGAYTFSSLYYAKVPNLTSAAATNWVITNFPMTYLYGCLAAARGLANDDQPAGGSRFEIWAKRFDARIKGIEKNDAKDLDARTHVTLVPDTSMFSRSGRSNIEADA